MHSVTNDLSDSWHVYRFQSGFLKRLLEKHLDKEAMCTHFFIQQYTFY